jgi:hypothetical protein
VYVTYFHKRTSDSGSLTHRSSARIVCGCSVYLLTLPATVPRNDERTRLIAGHEASPPRNTPLLSKQIKEPKESNV